MASTEVKRVLLCGSDPGETSGYEALFHVMIEYGNQHATWLMANPNEGVAPRQWQDGIGYAIVAKRDGKDISSHLLGIIADYASMLMDAYGGGNPNESWFKPNVFRKYVLKQDPKLKESDIQWECPSDWVLKPSPSPLHQARALKSTGGQHFASYEFSAARKSYLAARQLLARAYPYEKAMDDEEVVELLHILLFNIAIASLKLDDPENAITEAKIATLCHPLADFSNKNKAKAYYTLGSAKFKSMKMGARNLGARRDLLEAEKLALGEADIARALKEVREFL